MNINGFGVPGKLPQNWSSQFLMRVRADYPKLQITPGLVRKIGVTPLTLSSYYSWPAVARVGYKNNRDLILAYGKREINFAIRNVKDDTGYKHDFILGVFNKAGVPVKITGFREKIPVIVSFLSPDVAATEALLGRKLPNDCVFAVTYEGGNIFKIESLDEKGINVCLNLTRQPEIREDEEGGIVQENSLKLEQTLSFLSLKELQPKGLHFLVLKVSTKGEMLEDIPKVAATEEYFEVIFRIWPDMSLSLSELETIISISGIRDGNEILPGIIRKLMLDSASLYNMCLRSQQN